MNNKILMVVAIVVVILLIVAGIVFSTRSPEEVPQPAENSAAVAEPVSASEAEIDTVDLGGDVDASLQDVDSQINSL